MAWRIRIKLKHLNEKNITVLGCSDFAVKAVQKTHIDNGTLKVLQIPINPSV